MTKVKIHKDGDSLVMPLPTEVSERLQVAEGDTLLLVECEGGYRLKPYDPDYDDKMTQAEKIMGRYRKTLRGLASS
jgi:putative addiction module antidote